MDNTILSKMFEIGHFAKSIMRTSDLKALQLPLNITQLRTLLHIKCNQCDSMRDVSDKIGLEKSSFSRSVCGLVKKGYVIQSFDTSDRRRIKLDLTETGEAVCFEIYLATKKKMTDMLSALNGEQALELSSSLDKVLDIINKMEK